METLVIYYCFGRPCEQKLMSAPTICHKNNRMKKSPHTSPDLFRRHYTLYHHNIYIYTKLACVCILVIMIQHVIRRHKTPITIVIIMKIQCEAVQKGIDENIRHCSSAARGWKTEIKTCTFQTRRPYRTRA